MALILENKNQEEVDALSAPRGNTITPDMITREALKPPPTEPLAQTFSISGVIVGVTGSVGVTVGVIVGVTVGVVVGVSVGVIVGV